LKTTRSGSSGEPTCAAAPRASHDRPAAPAMPAPVRPMNSRRFWRGGIACSVGWMRCCILGEGQIVDKATGLDAQTLPDACEAGTLPALVPPGKWLELAAQSPAD